MFTQDTGLEKKRQNWIGRVFFSSVTNMEKKFINVNFKQKHASMLVCLTLK
jgi:hypothetical protein